MKTNQWLEAITELRRAEIEKPPKGFQPRDEVHKQLGLSRARGDEVLRRLVKAGKAEKRLFRINPGVRPVPHYRVR